MKAYIKHISEFYPEKSYTNDDFYKEFPEVEAQKEILSRVGVSNRYVVDEKTTSSDIAVQAAEKMFEEHDVNPKDIEFVIFCSGEFDYITPTSSAIIQNSLGLSNNVGAIDLVSSCTGFVQSLSIAKGMIEGCGLKNVLLLCVSTITKEFHKKDFNSKYLFGDAATATLVGSREEFGIGNFVFGTDGSRSDYIIIRDGGGRNPIDENSFTEEINEYGNVTCKANFYMNGAGVFLFGMKTVPKLIENILEKNKAAFDEIDYFVFHQANHLLLEILRKKIKIPANKFIIHLENTGNTVAATIPIALNSILKNGVAKSGDTILFAAFGTGLTWGGTVVRL
ncbi:MAG: 3-oxoacyl-ACP synthase [Flavobacteriales bacterium]|nr:MAG: 3-oxoacyl-ACP synthase [Flavobacteriales bacterium]